jgi:hypothetical protein
MVDGDRAVLEKLTSDKLPTFIVEDMLMIKKNLLISLQEVVLTLLQLI